MYLFIYIYVIFVLHILKCMCHTDIAVNIP